MTKYRALLVGAALLAGSAFNATAADLYGRGGSIKDGYMPMPMHSSPHAWYVRGDVGHIRYDDPTMIEVGRFDLNSTSIDNQWSAGLGFGYYFSKNVRGDLTWSHLFETDAQGRVPAPLVNFPGTRQFGLKSDVFLANIYYDFDTRSRFTPYIGMGIGLAHNKTTNGTVVDDCACPTGGYTNVAVAGASQWSVAAALMTGVSMNVRDRLHFDAGYRGLYLGEAHTGLITGTTGGALPTERTIF